MKHILLIAALATISQITSADTITQVASPTTSFASERGFSLVFGFSPVSNVPGDVTAVTLSFSGTVTPGIRADSTGMVQTVTLVPRVNFFNDLPGSANVLPPTTVVEGIGTPVTLPFNTTVTGSPQPITAAASFAPSSSFLQALASGPFVEPVFFFSPPTKPFGGFIGGSDVRDANSGNGTLTLTVTYTPVPEPMSLALLGAGVLAVVGTRRRWSARQA